MECQLILSQEDHFSDFVLNHPLPHPPCSMTMKVFSHEVANDLIGLSSPLLLLLLLPLVLLLLFFSSFFYFFFLILPLFFSSFFYFFSLVLLLFFSVLFYFFFVVVLLLLLFFSFSFSPTASLFFLESGRIEVLRCLRYSLNKSRPESSQHS